MTDCRSKLAPADRGDYVFKVDAAYGSERPVCSVCWSQLDFDWGRGHVGHELDELKPLPSEEYIDTQGTKWYVSSNYVKCMNPSCDAAALVRVLPAKLSFENPWHPDDRKAHKITSARYKKGHHRSDGVFVHKVKGVWKTMRVDLGTRGVELEYDHPWLYVHPGELAEDIPTAWTQVTDEEDKNWIKTSVNSRRFKDIRKWFAERRIRFEDLIEDLPE